MIVGNAKIIDFLITFWSLSMELIAREIEDFKSLGMIFSICQF